MQQITFALVPRFNMMTLTGLIEPLRVANYLSSEPLYEWRTVSLDEGRVVASNGLDVNCTSLPVCGRDDVIVLLGSWGCERDPCQGMASWIRAAHRAGAHICAVDLGLYVVARAGLLAEHRGTLHWSCLAGFRERFPEFAIDEQLYTQVRRFDTCAGGTAGIDYALSLIARAHGRRLADEVADQMLYPGPRPADAPQRRSLDQATDVLPPNVRRAVALIEANIAEPLKIPELAAEVGLSQRQLERQVRRAMGCSIVQLSQLLRLQHARVLLVSTGLSIREVAVASGFNTLSHFSQAFGKCFGKRPSEYRQMWPEAEDAPSWPGSLGTFVDQLRAGAPH